MAMYPAIYFLFAALSLLFFIQYPLSGSLAGDLDTIANLAMFKHLKMYLDFQLFNGDVPPDFCHPAKNTWLLYGADFGSGIIHIFFNYLVFNDLWANCFYYSTIFSLNGFTLFLLIRKILNRGWIAPILSSLVFTFSHFMLANLENPNTLIFFSSFLSLFFLVKYLSVCRIKDIVLSILLGGLTIYLSPTNFVMHILVWVFFIYYFNQSVTTNEKIRMILYSGLSYLILVLPYFYYFIYKIYQLELYNPINESLATKYFSLHLNDLFEVLKGHLYFTAREMSGHPWLGKIKSAYLGVVFYLTFFSGIVLIKKTRPFLILFLVALVISLGPVLMINFKEIEPSVMYPFFEYLNFGNYIRIPVRYFFISVLSATIVIAFLFDYMEQKKRYILLTGIFLITLLENVPLKMETYGTNQQVVLNPDKRAFEYLENKPEIRNLLFLPSDILNYKGDRNEYIYMYWQSFHYKNIVNGNLALFPGERMFAKELTDHFGDESIQRFFDLYDVDAFVFAKSLAGEESEAILTKLKKSENLLKLTFEDNDFIVFEKNI